MSRHELGERLDQSVDDDLPPHLEILEQDKDMFTKKNSLEMKAAENTAYSSSTDSIDKKNGTASDPDSTRVEVRDGDDDDGE